ncbi:Flp family type IVb pilin [Stappia sp. BW2]|jgi:pilus assembly protein Flp/PilA|uniref:Flp family type IVb pilin n=1 Tax=Stappia sp. BW2 TaxID=2592622 RepID=UPI0011DE876E|nr:Flp family type IVb pilin [Stappia sp. BW2]TYC69912.1 Flp family type IVb pilin [Stappia sp. BW2]
MPFRFQSVTDRVFSAFSRRREFVHDTRGATMIEYGLIVGFISIIILISMATIGTTMRDDIFGKVTTTLQGVLGST